MCKGPTRAERNSEARHPRDAGIRDTVIFAIRSTRCSPPAGTQIAFRQWSTVLAQLLSEKKTLTEDGRSGKNAYSTRSSFKRRKNKAALPLLKSYVCLFQSSEPLIHKLNDKQELLWQFLSNFVYLEKILGGAKLATHELSKDMGQLMKRTYMFCGEHPDNASKNNRCVVCLERHHRAKRQNSESPDLPKQRKTLFKCSTAMSS